MILKRVFRLWPQVVLVCLLVFLVVLVPGQCSEIDELVADLSQSDVQIQLNALKQLQLLGVSEYSSAVIPLLESLETQVRQEAAVTLVSFGIASLPDLEKVIRQNHSMKMSTRLEVVKILGKIGDPSCIDILQLALADPDLNVRRGVILTLEQLGLSEEKVIDTLVLGLEDNSPQIRQLAANTLRRVKPELLLNHTNAVAALLMARSDRDTNVAVSAAMTIRPLGTGISKALIEIIKDSTVQANIREAAAKELVIILPESATTSLKGIMLDQTQDLCGREIAALELANLAQQNQDSGALTVLVEALEVDDNEFRLIVASILVRKFPQVVIPELDDLIPELSFMHNASGNPSRGYLTTPEELEEIAQKAEAGIEPYKTNVAEFLRFIGPPEYWPYGDISGEVNVFDGSSSDPPHLSASAAKLVYGKAIAYYITGNEKYAKVARVRILDLIDTYGFGGNQSILNLARGGTPYIYAADLLEPYLGWSLEDKRQFQTWLKDEMYPKVAWASRVRKNNWGVAGSLSAAVIADYLSDTGWTLTEISPHFLTLSLAEAYQQHNLQQIYRQSTEKLYKMDAKRSIWGIMPYGGIPEEIRRGSNPIDGLYLERIDSGGDYTMTYIEHLTAHAEFLWRRGDSSLYDNIFADGSGSLLQAIKFVIDNPIKSHPWEASRRGALHIAYRYYRDESILKSLDQYGPGTIEGQRLSLFGRLTHQFAPDENPGPPPITEPPK